MLRVGVSCAVIDDGGRVLLSHRADFNLWNLPGGRLDTGEILAEAAGREVREETGVIAHIERPVNLYFSKWQREGRINVGFAGWPLGGELLKRTSETRDNRYFSPDALPKNVWGEERIRDAFASARPLPVIKNIPRHRQRWVRLGLGWRWIKNYLRGQPEPKFPKFHVRSVAVLWDESFNRVLTLPGKRGRILPRVPNEGQDAPWVELADSIQEVCGLEPVFQWVGLWQDPPRDVIEFVFAAALPEKLLSGQAEWSKPQNAALGDRDLAYVERVKPTYLADPVWTIIHQGEIGQGGTLVSEKN